jgi:hypothetical protein
MRLLAVKPEILVPLIVMALVMEILVIVRGMLIPLLVMH